MSSTNSYPEIISTLKEKSNLKQLVYDNTMTAFKLLIEVLQDTTNTCNAELPDEDQRIKLEFSHVGDFDARLKVAGDLLVFNMHSNIFQFDRNHEIWKTAYVKDDVMAGYSGIISVYNFLSDSFKYNRMDDLGYLIARIFINKDNFFFVQGKRQSGFGFATLGSKKMSKFHMTEIVKAAIQYCLDFDLLTPPYDNVKLANVAQIQQTISDAKMRTGKRLGFQFRSDDVNE